MTDKELRQPPPGQPASVIRPHRIISAQIHALAQVVRKRLHHTLFWLRMQRKFIFLLSLLAVIVIFNFLLPGHPDMVRWYNARIFKPFQNVRNFLFGHVPFSIGDLLYVFLILLLITVCIRWLYFLFHIRSEARYFGASVLNSINVLVFFYVIFFLGWGGNYYKPPLAKYWGLDTKQWQAGNGIFEFDKFLIDRLNQLVPDYQPEYFKATNRQAKLYYQQFTNSKTRLHGLNAKPSMFGYFMQYLGIQGYYNPITGEAQVNRFLPAFMLPFVVCHEMAHQSGIAAEGDANLLAYALCTQSGNKTFAYSGYFNIWLYTHNRAMQLDSNRAKQAFLALNPVSSAQVDTLREIRHRYKGLVNKVSGELYDSYLRWHNQKEGIDSYFKVIKSAWAFEQHRKTGTVAVLRIP